MLCFVKKKEALYITSFWSHSAGLRALCASRHKASFAAYFEEKRGFQIMHNIDAILKRIREAIPAGPVRIKEGREIGRASCRERV